MRRAEISAKLRVFPYDPAEYWAIMGSAMVLYGFREETHDIDLGCTKKLADELEAAGFLYKIMDDGNRWFRLDEKLEVFENWLHDHVVFVDGVPVISVQGLLQMKQVLGREKDLRDIRLIQEKLEEERGEGTV
ncbi:MAG: hypothetical protein IJQ02_17125 [Oscillospiraceae bacterium]|nr:hypothetical protein [Oscillospiraceae bacterium]